MLSCCVSPRTLDHIYRARTSRNGQIMGRHSNGLKGQANILKSIWTLEANSLFKDDIRFRV